MRRILPVCFLFLCIPGIAQEIRLKGHVATADGDVLPSAHILVAEDSTVLICDSNGNFVYRTAPAKLTLRISYTGYSVLQTVIDVRRDTSVVFSLTPDIGKLEEVVVTGQRFSQQEIFESTRTSATVITPTDINAIPALGGEADLIKAVQLLPGTIQGIEGSADLFVRGGAADQNLVLLDQIPVYNTSHL